MDNTKQRTKLKEKVDDKKIDGIVLEGFTQADNLVRASLISNMSSAAYATYITLLSHRNAKTGECFPSANLLAQELGKSRSYVFHVLNKLEEEGYIKIVKGDRTTSNRYYFPYEKFYKNERTKISSKTSKTTDEGKIEKTENAAAENSVTTQSKKKVAPATQKEKKLIIEDPELDDFEF